MSRVGATAGVHCRHPIDAGADGEPRAACRVELGPGQGHRLNVAKEPTPGRVTDSSFHAIEDGVGLSSDGIALARPCLVARNVMC